MTLLLLLPGIMPPDRHVDLVQVVQRQEDEEETVLILAAYELMNDR